MTENHLCDAAIDDFCANKFFGYGWGLCGRVHIDPVRSCSLSPAGEFGWNGAAGAFAMVDSINQVAIFYLMHVRGCQYAYRSLHPRIVNAVYEAIGNANK